MLDRFEAYTELFVCLEELGIFELKFRIFLNLKFDFFRIKIRFIYSKFEFLQVTMDSFALCP